MRVMTRKAVLICSNYQKPPANWVRTATLLSVVFLNICQAGAQIAEPSAEAHKSWTVPRCAKIAASDPRFGPLAEACEYALSPNNLLSFVCDESAQQFRSTSGPNEWQNVAVVTAVVTFEPGKGDRFSNVAKDGHPIRGLSKPHKGGEVDTHFAFYLKSRAPRLNLFGTDLFWVFDARDEAQFEHKGEMDADDRTMIVFGFHVTKSPKHLPAIGWQGQDDDGQYLGMKGLLWIDKANSSLRRFVVHYTDFEPQFGISAMSSAIDYSWVQIGDLGKFLLPTGAEHIVCNQRGTCQRDIIGFSNCHKYAGKSGILPAQ